jgi:16S rRNA processing protein RimM
MLNIAKVLKSQGLNGELKLLVDKCYMDSIGKIDRVFVDDICYLIKKCRVDKFVFVNLQGIDDRTAADKMQNKCVFVDRQSVQLKDYEYFFDDILGCSVYLDTLLLGVVMDIGQYGAADVHVIKCSDGKILRHPFLKKLILSIDIKNKKIYYDRVEFLKVCVIDNEE